MFQIETPILIHLALMVLYMLCKSLTELTITLNIVILLVICPGGLINQSDFQSTSKPHHEGVFSEVWNLHLTVPVVMIFILGPLVNMKSPDFFAKFSAMGITIFLSLFHRFMDFSISLFLLTLPPQVRFR